MKKSVLILAIMLLCSLTAQSQGLKRVYNEKINTMLQIDSALVEAAQSSRFVICQVGGNWCPWCLRFADFITTDAEINEFVNKNFVYIHVNYSRSDKSETAQATMARLGNPQRFGFPVFVVLNSQGNVLHTQNSSFLESGKTYDRDKVLRFMRNWTPQALAQ
ncbi:MAG: thioredoxin family protein [Muribaculaceae bacterium]